MNANGLLDQLFDQDIRQLYDQFPGFSGSATAQQLDDKRTFNHNTPFISPILLHACYLLNRWFLLVLWVSGDSNSSIQRLNYFEEVVPKNRVLLGGVFPDQVHALIEVFSLDFWPEWLAGEKSGVWLLSWRLRAMCAEEGGKS